MDDCIRHVAPLLAKYCRTRERLILTQACSMLTTKFQTNLQFSIINELWQNITTENLHKLNIDKYRFGCECHLICGYIHPSTELDGHNVFEIQYCSKNVRESMLNCTANIENYLGKVIKVDVDRNRLYIVTTYPDKLYRSTWITLWHSNIIYDINYKLCVPIGYTPSHVACLELQLVTNFINNVHPLHFTTKLIRWNNGHDDTNHDKIQDVASKMFDLISKHIFYPEYFKRLITLACLPLLLGNS